ncbi:MAG: glycoside hydrolase family 15 protein [Burkholderiales bacterium]|nr:glycoside hydrolase family 15 protein [Burkholderiales bacterium]
MAEKKDENRGDYLPIADYAAIGDCHGGTLVSSEGRIDWCCLQRFDCDPVFCRLLDDDKGGFLSLKPRVNFKTTRAYLDGANVLRTEFHPASGRIAVTDFMPVGRTADARPHDYVSLNAPNWLVRKVEGLQGEVVIESIYRPSVAFARHRAQLSKIEGAILAEDGPTLYSDMPFAIAGERARAMFAVCAGEVRFIAVAAKPAAVTRERIDELLTITIAFWREWIWYCRYDGPYAEAVKRSALAIKLLTYAPTGATVAALTTSLPEQLGGERNWDYRYCWIRDASLMLYALAGLGYASEATQFYNFINAASSESFSDLQVLYGVHHEKNIQEQLLNHLDGYARSRPVRCGNGAHDQRQTDLYARHGRCADLQDAGRQDRGQGNKNVRRVDGVSRTVLGRTRSGNLGNARGAPAFRAFQSDLLGGGRSRDPAVRRTGWLGRLCDRILNETVARGRGAAGDHFCQSFSGDASDASLLLLPAMGFPADERVLRRTLEAVESELRRGEFVWRYAGEDGLEGE